MARESGFAGLLVVDLTMPGSQSLKDKRSPLRSIRQRLRDAGFSVAEVAHHDTWQRAQLAISVVARTATDVDHLLDEAIRMCDRPDIDIVVRQHTVIGMDELA